MELKRYSLFELVDKLNQLVKFSGGSFTLKSGAVERVFIEDNPVEPVIMYRDGGGDYAIDAGGLAVFTAITNFEHEYPEEYKKFMEIYETYDESQEVNISADNIEEFEKIVKIAYSTKPS